ncbi:MAG: M6 family metalloprotease domain-containing protein [Candidatus Kapabacteria bacterium]|nr:M6 family metalloprotease domain-containing protein [Candidatus Kapabacteria bacterium]
MKINKLFLPLLFFIFVSSSLNAAFMKNIPMALSQPNGEQINIYASGDEIYNYLHDANNYTIIQNPKTGYYCYAIISDGKLISSNFVFGTVNPLTLGIPKGLRISDEELQMRLHKFDMPPKPIINKANNQIQTSNIGLINNLVIFIRFSDQTEWTDQTSFLDNQFNNPNTSSMFNFYKEVSYNQLQIKTTFYPIASGSTIVSFQDSHPRNYYSPYSVTNTIGYTNDSSLTYREHNLLKSAANAVSSQVPVSLIIDNDNDGLIDNVAFYVEGTNDAWASLLWPHMWALYTYDVKINGKRIWNYNFFIQNPWIYQSRAVSVLCHEMFHSLGAPDLYHYVGNGIQPADGWDLMENDAPQHMGAFMKWKYGKWISSIPEITCGGTYTVNSLLSPTNNAFKIKSPNSATEYFYVEYRQNTGLYESLIPGKGLLVYRINTAAGDGNASGPPDEVYIYRPGGTTTVNGTPANAAFSLESGRTQINDATNPSSFLSTGAAGGLLLDQVSSYSSSTMSFRISFAIPVSTLNSPANTAISVKLNPSFAWSNPLCVNYHRFQVSDKIDFSNIIYDKQNLLSSSINMTDYTLKPYTTYYWRVQSTSGGYTTAWSPSYSFSTRPDDPQIKKQSYSQYGCKGSIVNFFMVPTSAQSVTLQYQWQKDGVDLAGQTNPSMILTNVDYQNSGIYRCKVTDFPYDNVVYTDEMPLYVGMTPSIQRQPVNAVASLGEGAIFDFQLHANFLPPLYQPSIQWYRGTTALTDNNKYAGTKSSLLTIKDVAITDLGNDYYAVITSLCGSNTTAKGTLTEKPSVQISLNPIDAASCEGKDAIFTADATIKGTGTVVYQWNRNNIPLTDGARISGAATKQLTVKSVQSSDIGKYNLFITINPGNIQAKTSDANLTTLKTPNYPNYVDSALTAQSGKNLSLVCDIIDDPSYTYQWQFKNIDIAGATTKTFTKATITSADAGLYRCIIKNTCGSDTSKNFDVSVTYYNLTLVEENSSNGYVLYSPVPNPANENCEVSFYLPEDNFAQVILYDIQGKVVANLLDNKLNQGMNKFKIDAAKHGLKSGIYILSLKVKGLVLTEKISIIH